MSLAPDLSSEPVVDVLTIGHSNHPFEHFLALLRNAGVTAIADVRTSPYSRQQPHFNRDALPDELRRNGISYVFLGKELGGRPSDRQFYCDGIADYETMAKASAFGEGLNRVIDGARTYRIALMCSEHNPLDCHRCLLVGRALAERGVRVGHILSDGKTITHAEVEDRLLEIAGRSAGDFFAQRGERLAAAYRDRARKVAFAEPQPGPNGSIAAE
jgi:uncharacterized protein (DUF488 family)